MNTEVIFRKNYINKIKPYIGKPLIKVLTGQHREIRNTAFLENLVLFLSDNIGQLFSAKKIKDLSFGKKS